MKTLNICIGLAMAMVLGTAHLLDGPDDHHAEWAQAEALSDAQKQARRELRRDMAAAKVCREQHGEAGFSWTEAGSLVCHPKRGRTVVASVQP